MKTNEVVLTEKIVEAVKILYESIKERKIKEFLEEIKDGGQNEKQKQRVQN